MIRSPFVVETLLGKGERPLDYPLAYYKNIYKVSLRATPPHRTELTCGAFDLYRGKLLERLAYRHVPKTVKDEQGHVVAIASKLRAEVAAALGSSEIFLGKVVPGDPVVRGGPP